MSTLKRIFFVDSLCAIRALNTLMDSTLANCLNNMELNHHLDTKLEELDADFSVIIVQGITEEQNNNFEFYAAIKVLHEKQLLAKFNEWWTIECKKVST